MSNIFLHNTKFYQTTAYGNFRRYLQESDLILEEGEKDGSFRPGIKSHSTNNLLLGVFSASTLRMLYLEDCLQQNLI